MNSIREKALLHLTGQPSAELVPVDQLEALVKSYPYFSPAHVLHSARLKQTGNTAAYQQSVGKSLLHVTNPLWMQYLVEADIAPAIIGMPETPVVDKHKQQTAIPSMEDVRDIIRSIDPRKIPDNPPGVDDTEEIALDDTEVLPLPDTKLSGLLSEQLANFKKPVEAGDKLEIETKRLHTIDYFASLGIKVDLNSMPQDKLTFKLRKFTDWLKEMKHVNQQTTDLGTGSDLEQAVALIAENSNESKEVVTETMAEVLEKQGQTEKAIQLYIKLSFINPEKSAYFAAKIQHLKGI